MFRLRPTPVYAINAAIVSLEPSELFVLCLARLWVVHQRNPETVPADWREGFAHMRMDAESEAGFDQLFRLIVTAATRSLDIRCQRCEHLGEDEGWLLHSVSLLQGSRIADAAAIFSDWLPAGSVGRAIGSWQAFAAGLAARGLSLPRHPAMIGTGRSELAHPPLSCGAKLLH